MSVFYSDFFPLKKVWLPKCSLHVFPIAVISFWGGGEQK